MEFTLRVECSLVILHNLKTPNNVDLLRYANLCVLSTLKANCTTCYIKRIFVLKFVNVQEVNNFSH